MMAGDGVDDVPAPAAVYVGTTLDSSTDVATETVDVTLTYDDPPDIVKIIRIPAGMLAEIK